MNENTQRVTIEHALTKDLMSQGTLMYNGKQVIAISEIYGDYAMVVADSVSEEWPVYGDEVTFIPYPAEYTPTPPAAADALTARVASLEAALAFYADADNYDEHGWVPVELDGGKIARKALGREIK